MSQRNGSVSKVLATKADSMCSSPGTHMPEGEHRLQQVAL